MEELKEESGGAGGGEDVEFLQGRHEIEMRQIEEAYRLVNVGNKKVL